MDLLIGGAEIRPGCHAESIQATSTVQLCTHGPTLLSPPVFHAATPSIAINSSLCLFCLNDFWHQKDAILHLWDTKVKAHSAEATKSLVKALLYIARLAYCIYFSKKAQSKVTEIPTSQDSTIHGLEHLVSFDLFCPRCPTVCLCSCAKQRFTGLDHKVTGSTRLVIAASLLWFASVGNMVFPAGGIGDKGK